MPRLTGRSADAASVALRRAGLRAIGPGHGAGERSAHVVGQSPAPGARVERGSTVRLELSGATPGVSAGRETTASKVTVPRLGGLSLDQARRDLREQGLGATVDRVAASGVPGMVVGQRPVAGAQLRRGMTVTVRVAAPPDRVLVPDVAGLDEASARRELSSAGFAVQVVDRDVGDPSQDGTVLSATPRAGTRASKGATVTIAVGRAVDQTQTQTETQTETLPG